MLALARWQRVAVVALLILPILVIVLLSVPVWMSWPWLQAERRADVLALVEKLTACLRAFVRADRLASGEPERRR
ncbi:hypothetical protein [Planomonospora sp. ID82291]|uniref:hypothetical protein n=1 Tax=Planomonospora sp. ID82291 TaxID=2738136 RepID=UPI0018C3AD34|nr:hypothetical protein [Planomonospora sp. ID82291]MBG0814716.1 hypothetical protein [Planomonospora sp. ID82291]